MTHFKNIEICKTCKNYGYTINGILPVCRIADLNRFTGTKEKNQWITISKKIDHDTCVFAMEHIVMDCINKNKNELEILEKKSQKYLYRYINHEYNEDNSEIPTFLKRIIHFSQLFGLANFIVCVILKGKFVFDKGECCFYAMYKGKKICGNYNYIWKHILLSLCKWNWMSDIYYNIYNWRIRYDVVPTGCTRHKFQEPADLIPKSMFLQVKNFIETSENINLDNGNALFYDKELLDIYCFIMNKDSKIQEINSYYLEDSIEDKDNISMKDWQYRVMLSEELEKEEDKMIQLIAKIHKRLWS